MVGVSMVLELGEQGAQPMIAQTRSVLEAYQANGGTYQEVVFENSAHAPFLEEQERFLGLFSEHVKNSNEH